MCSEVEWSVVGWSLNDRKWGVDKCSEVEWSVVGWSLNERKWSVDKCSELERSVVGWSVVNWSGVKVLVTGCLTLSKDIQITWSLLFIWLCRLSHSFIFFGSILHHCIYGCVFCMLLFSFCKLCYFIGMFIYSYCNVYVLLLLCTLCSVYYVSLCCSVYRLCVHVYCTTANGCQPNWS